MAKHTRGPWKILEVHNGEYQVGAAGQTDAYEGMDVAVCRILVDSWDGEPPQKQIEANACLIAAAPELLAACEQLESFIGVMFGRGADAVIPETVALPIGVPCKLGDIMRETAAAIAKAKAVTPPPAAKE